MDREPWPWTSPSSNPHVAEPSKPDCVRIAADDLRAIIEERDELRRQVKRLLHHCNEQLFKLRELRRSGVDE